MIHELKTQAEVDAIKEPKQVWYDIGRIVVRTGDDMELPSVQEQIAQIESQVTPRMLREAALGIDKTRLQAINTQIAELRKKL